MMSVYSKRHGFTPLEASRQRRLPRLWRGPLTGFTLLETMVVIAVIVLIGTLAMVSATSSRRGRDLTTAGQSVLSVFGTAQGRAVAGEDALLWGVRLGHSQFILFSGPAYAESGTTTVYDLPAGIEIDNVVLSGGGSDVVFRRLDGRTEQAGTFDVRIVASPGQTFPITIDASGRSYRTGVASILAGTRITDTRHRSFTLGWSIENASTMTLTFSNPPSSDIVVPVTMTPASPRATYDWSGTTVVGGLPQTVRIHALSITGSDTVLSVDRDCRKSTKKLAIAIDAKAIATYEADCATVIVEAFGGVISEP